MPTFVPLLMVMLPPDVESGDFFAPAIAGAIGPHTTGPVSSHPPELSCASRGNTELLWAASEEAIGETFVVR